MPICIAFTVTENRDDLTIYFPHGASYIPASMFSRSVFNTEDDANVLAGDHSCLAGRAIASNQRTPGGEKPAIPWAQVMAFPHVGWW